MSAVDIKIFQVIEKPKDCLLLKSDIKYFGAFLTKNIYFHDHVGVIFSECIKQLNIIRSINLRFSSLQF
jgi:hypothetical protein